MKIIKALSISILSIASSTLPAQPKATGGEAKVNEAITKLFDGIAELDFEKIKRHCTSDLIVLENGAFWTLDSLTTHLEPLKGIDFKRTNTLTFIKSDVRGNTAWVIYNNSADMTIRGRPRKVNWLESAVLLREGKDWKVQLLHSTTLPGTNHERQ